MYLVGKIKDIKKLKGNFFNPPRYTWIENCLWLDSIPTNQLLLVSSEITDTYKLELDYLISSGRSDFQYLNDDVENAITQYLTQQRFDKQN